MTPEKLTRSQRLQKISFIFLIMLLVAMCPGLAPFSWAQTPVEVRNLETGPLGFPAPAGLGYSNNADTFFVLETPPTPLPATTDIIVLDDLGALVGTATLAASVEDPLNTTFDNNGNRLLIYQPGSSTLLQVPTDALGILQPASLTSVDASPFGLNDPRGMTVDPATGDLFVLDASGPRIVRVVPDAVLGFAQPVVSEIALASGLGDLRGIAFDPASGNFQVLNPIGQLLHELTGTGQLVQSRDVSGIGLLDPKAMIFAPSGDLTDDPSVLTLYIADSGSPAEPGNITELRLNPLAIAPQAVAAATTPFVSTLVQRIDTSVPTFLPNSPDTAGAAYMSSGFYAGSIFLADSEVNEVTGAVYTGTNLWEITLGGTVNDTFTTDPFFADLGLSTEPVGLAFNPANNRLFISNDNSTSVTELDPGADGQFNTADDTFTSFSTAALGNNDNEGITFDPNQGYIYISDGVNNEIYEVRPGPNGIFDGVASDDEFSTFDVGAFGVVDPEGIAFNPTNNFLYIVGRNSEKEVMVVTTSGALVEIIDIDSANIDKPAGMAYAPSSVTAGEFDIYITDRGEDNGNNPAENDGAVYELTLPPPITPGNTPPTADVGPDQLIDLPADAIINAITSDDGLVSPLTFTWTQQSGPPGGATFTPSNTEDTTVSFSTSGTYILRLTVFDGELPGLDELTVTVTNAGELTIQKRVDTASDDAEEQPTSSVSTGSSDLEFTFDQNGNQTVGIRFTNLNIPQGATISNASIQFQVDEQNSAVTNLTIVGEEVPNAATFVSTSGSISARLATATSASVPWSPPAWNTVGLAGPDQQTPNIGAIIQEIVAQGSWASGNALVILFTGTGERTAESFNGDPAGAPLLSVSYSTGPPVTVPDVVGLTQANAEADIIAESLTVGIVTTQNDPVVPAGNVISQNPLAGATVAAGTAVNLVVSLGPVVLVNVPDVVGLPQTPDAEAAIVTAGLTVGIVTTQNDPVVPAGNVISQNPLAGASVVSGTAVDLVVSLGPVVLVIVPDVVGLPQATAEADILNANLTVGNVTTQADPVVPVGNVISQNPLALASVPETTPVDLVISAGNSLQIDVRVSQDSDDAEELSSGSVGLNSSDLEMTFDQGSDQTVGIRFNGLILPQGATITNAYVQFEADETGSVATNVNIQGEKIPNAPTFVSSNSNISSRLLTSTSASVAWSPPAWNTVGEAGPDQQTPNINSVIQEIVGQGSWAPGNSLVILITGTGERTAESFDGKASAAPLLHVEYTIGPTVPVPDVVGLPQTPDAEADIVAATLIVGNVTTQTDPVVPAGNVISQNPTAGANVAAGTPVDLVVSLGPPAQVSVPPVVGLQQGIAEADIVTATLVVGNVTTQTDPVAPFGEVLSQNPPAGASVSSGTAVDLVVSLGPPVSVPPVVGLPQATAEADILTATLNVGNVTTQSDGVVPAGDVISQNPPGGSSVPTGTAVDLVISSGLSGSTIDIRVNADSDDAEELASSSVSLNSSDLEMTFDQGGSQKVGMRFNAVTIPACSTITNAYVQFQADEAGSVATNVDIFGEDTDNALVFINSDGNISDRLATATSVSVAWSIAAWNAVGEAGLNQRTPNLSSIIQEIVLRPGWVSGNSLAILITGTGERAAESHDGKSSAAPELHVESFPSACP